MIKIKLSECCALIAIALLISGCSDAGKDQTPENIKNKGFHKSDPNSTDSNKNKNGLVEFVRGRKLQNYQKTTIGKAFDDYEHFVDKQWYDSRGTNKNIYIDFIGWNKGEAKKEGVIAIGYDVKFVIKPDGSWFVAMVSRLEKAADGTLDSIPLDDMKKVLDSLYGNKKLD